ncbi:unnamed protein product, partial [marine sediment metagenome]
VYKIINKSRNFGNIPSKFLPIIIVKIINIVAIAFIFIVGFGNRTFDIIARDIKKITANI